jgi:hypothetical protein
MIKLRNARDYIENFLSIRTKSGALVPFRFNAAQEKLYNVLKAQNAARKPMRAIVLKARQLGISTLAEGLIYQRTATRENTNSLVIAHLDSSTANLLAMTKLFYERSPEEVRPMIAASNARELAFENPVRDVKRKKKNPGLGSRIRCMTAGSGFGVGRSYTFRNVHMSEFAYWRGDKTATYGGIMQAVPSEPGTLVIVESTANGFEEFKKLWDLASAGQSDFAPVFFPWFEEPGYRMPVPPGTVWTDEEAQMRERFALDDTQLAWRRWCIRNNCAGDERSFRQEYPATPDEAFLTSGAGVFNNEVVMARRSAAPEPAARGEFQYDYDGIKIRNIRWEDREPGIIKLYEPPRERAPYVIGGDTAGMGSDRFTAQVLDNTTGRQVAVLKHQFDEVLYARQLYCLGWYYNRALLAPETNFSTFPVQELTRLDYPNLYRREVPDTFTGAVRDAYGFATTAKTRPAVIAGLVAVMLEAPELVVDFDTLGEMLTFVYDENRRAAAAPGEHDDLVMALAIAHAVRPWQSQRDAEVTAAPAGKLIDKLEKGKKRR